MNRPPSLARILAGALRPFTRVKPDETATAVLMTLTAFSC
jgi:hypothetical protein